MKVSSFTPNPPAVVTAPVNEVVEFVVALLMIAPALVIAAPTLRAPTIPTPPATCRAPEVVDVDGETFVIYTGPTLVVVPELV